MRRKPIIPPSIRAAAPRFPWAARSWAIWVRFTRWVAKNYGIDGEIYCAELDLTDAFALRLPDPTYHPLPKYPGVSRDLASSATRILPWPGRGRYLRRRWQAAAVREAL